MSQPESSTSTTTSSPTSTSSKASISQLKELLERENKLRKPDQRLVFVPPPTVQNGSEYIATCTFKCYMTRRIYTEEGRARSKKEAQHVACQNVLDAIAKDEELMVSGNFPRSPQREPEQVEGTPQSPPNYVSRTLSGSSSSTGSTPSKTVFGGNELPPLDDDTVTELASIGNHIGELQEYCVANGREPPIYTPTKYGPDHTPTFKMSCTVQTVTEHGVANNSKTAKKISALKVLQVFRPLSTAAVNRIDAALLCQSEEAIEDLVEPQIANAHAILVKQSIYYYPTLHLGSGGMGSVFQGYFEHFSKKAGVKRLKPGSKEKNINAEIEILRAIDDPNVVKYFATESNQAGEIFIAMVLASTTLENVVRTKTYKDVNELKRFLKNATKGVLALHRNKIIHRDIKPSNILIFQEGSERTAKIADFGISREVESITVGGQQTNVAGTPLWMAPELAGITIQDVTYHCDIYALGLTIFYTMSLGHHPMKGHEIDYPLLASCCPDLYPVLENLLQPLLSRETKARPKIEVVLEHPFFWDGENFLNFITYVGNELKANYKVKLQLNLNYEKFSKNRLGFHVNWKVRLCEVVKKYIDENQDHTKKVYDGSSLIYLVEFIRDKEQHAVEWKKRSLQNVFGPSTETYGNYFAKKFPEIATFIWTHLQSQFDKGEAVGEVTTEFLRLKAYYGFNKNSCFPVLI